MSVVHEKDITCSVYNSRDHNTVVNRTWVQITKQLYSLSRNSSRTRFSQHFLPIQCPKLALWLLVMSWAVITILVPT